MDRIALEKVLRDLPLGAVRYFARVGSTNDLADRWAVAGAPDLSLVVADEQTEGRGRLKRRWFTPPGSALAFSLILKDFDQSTAEMIPRFTALGALAVCDALNEALNPVLPAQIKWPNDVVATRRKLAGVLAEAKWQGDQLSAVILGIGINVAPQSVPPAEDLNFPATCVEAVLEKSVDRWGLLHAVLEKLLDWRLKLASENFLRAWNAHLAFRGEWVQVAFEDKPSLQGQVIALAPDGSLRLRARSGEEIRLRVGEIHLRPLEEPTGSM